MATVQAVSRYRWVILGIALLSQLSGATVSQVLAPLAPLFQADLGLTKAEVGLFISAAHIGMWGALLIGGSLIDRFGIRKAMSVSQVVAGALMLTMSMVGSVFQAAAVMFVSGAVRATIFPGATKAVLDWFPPRARATAMGLKQTGMPLGGVVMASTMPAIGLALGWRYAVAMVGFLIIASGVTAAVLYRDPPASGEVAVRKTGYRGRLGMAAHNRKLLMAAFIGLLFVSSQTAVITYLALYFKEVVLVDSVPDEPTRIVAAGGFLALCQMGGAFGRVFWGVVSDRVFRAQRLPVLAITGVLSALMTLSVGYMRPDYPLWLLSGLVVAAGVTIVGWNGVHHALVSETADQRSAGTGVGLSMTLTQAGNVWGAPVFGFVVDVSGSYAAGWWLLFSFYAAGTFMVLLAARGNRKAA